VETKVESLPVEEFPEIPRIKGDAIALPDSLRASIHEAMQCASTDETRIILNGAYIDVSKPEANYVVGTDGRHLYSSNSFALPLAQSLLIPAHRFLEWKQFSADGEWQLKVGIPEHKDAAAPFQISSRRWRYISRQIEGNYPNWRQVAPGPGSYATTIELETGVEEILQTIGRMPCDDTVNYAIGLESSDGKLSLLGRSPGAEDWTRIEVTGVKAKGKDMRIFLNRNLLTKALEFGLTTVETIDQLSPLRFSNGGRQMIVMPTRPNPAPAAAHQPTPPAPAAQKRAAGPERANGSGTTRKQNHARKDQHHRGHAAGKARARNCPRADRSRPRRFPQRHRRPQQTRRGAQAGAAREQDQRQGDSVRAADPPLASERPHLARK